MTGLNLRDFVFRQCRYTTLVFMDTLILRLYVDLKRLTVRGYISTHRERYTIANHVFPEFQSFHLAWNSHVSYISCLHIIHLNTYLGIFVLFVMHNSSRYHTWGWKSCRPHTQFSGRSQGGDGAKFKYSAISPTFPCKALIWIPHPLQCRVVGFSKGEAKNPFPYSMPNCWWSFSRNLEKSLISLFIRISFFGYPSFVIQIDPYFGAVAPTPNPQRGLFVHVYFLLP